MVQIVAFYPSSVEETGRVESAMDPEAFIPKTGESLASGIPRNQVPDYSVLDFSHISTEGGEKKWKLNSEKANLFNAEKIVHALVVRALLFDPDGKATLVTGKEAKFIMGQKDLEVFGDVQTTLPDGFRLKSEYLRYRPNERIIEIPSQYRVEGEGLEGPEMQLRFSSSGIHFAMAKSKIILPRTVQMTTQSASSERTTIESDRCEIQRDKRSARFTMEPSRPIESRFVRITQDGLRARARKVRLNYGEKLSDLNSLEAREDVLILETQKGAPAQANTPSAVKVSGAREEEEPLRYATGGKADFDGRLNRIILTEFPQVYQDNDTVTGEVITLHRDTDTVEVLHSNAFSQGSPDSPMPER